METATQSKDSATANQRLQRSAAQLLSGFNREMIARELGKKKFDKSPTYTPDALKEMMRNHLYKGLAEHHHAAPGFDDVFNKAAAKLDELIDSVASKM